MEVARQLEWSTSTIFRIETGRSRPQPGNVRTLLELYGVTGAERDGLIQLTREARQPGWWHSFRDVLPHPYEVYIGLEAGAASIRNFEPVVVPLRHLAESAQQGRTTIQVVPYRADAHAGAIGAFVILDFPEASDPAVVYVETLAGDIYLEERSDVNR